MALIKCPECGKKISNEAISCPGCGCPMKKSYEPIYKETFFSGKVKIVCPKCDSDHCERFYEQVVIPGKTKTTYSANLNPLKPFTFVNKKEKVIRKEQTYDRELYRCLECGKQFY